MREGGIPCKRQTGRQTYLYRYNEEIIIFNFLYT